MISERGSSDCVLMVSEEHSLFINFHIAGQGLWFSGPG